MVSPKYLDEHISSPPIRRSSGTRDSAWKLIQLLAIEAAEMVDF